MIVTLNLDPETLQRLGEKATRRGQTEAYLEQPEHVGQLENGS